MALTLNLKFCNNLKFTERLQVEHKEFFSEPLEPELPTRVPIIPQYHDLLKTRTLSYTTTI